MRWSSNILPMISQFPNAPLALAQIPILLRGEPAPMRFWIAEWRPARMCLYVALVIAGTAAFGMVVGTWRDPVQGLYNAIKFPLIVLLTAIGNGLLNGMLAPLLGTNISFRQSLVAVVMSFTIAAAVLGACSPIVAFVIWNAPALSATSADSRMTHSFILITVVAVIAVAGIAANVRLWHLLRQLSGSDSSSCPNCVGLARRQPSPGQPNFMDTPALRRVADVASAISPRRRVARKLFRVGFPLSSKAFLLAPTKTEL